MNEGAQEPFKETMSLKGAQAFQKKGNCLGKKGPCEKIEKETALKKE